MRAARFVLAFALLGPGALAAQEPVRAGLGQPVAEITLEDAIRLADQVQPQVVQARAGIDQANAQKRAVTGSWLPSLNATSTGGYLFSESPRFDPITGEFVTANSETRTVSAGLSTNWELFTGFRRGAERKAVRAQLSAAESGLLNAQYQQRFLTTQQFFAALATREITDVRLASVRRAEEQLNAAVVRLRAGTATRSDSLRSVVTLGNSRVSLATAEADQVAAEAALGRLVGLEGRVRAADDSAFYRVVVEADTAALLASATASSPAVLAAEAQEAQARAQLGAINAQYWPQLVLSGSWTYNGNDQRDFELFNQRQAQINLNWPIFNRFVRERNVDLQRAQIDIAAANAADARRQVRAQLVGQLAQLEAAQYRIEVAQQSLLASQEDLRVVGERYRLGVATLVDLLVSQEGLTTAELEFVNARFAYLQARAQIEALIGRSL
jgi:outer membrane protein TolC